MTPEEQRIAIAEACGWKRSDLRPSWCHPDNWLMAKNGSYEVWVSRDKLPDYLNDLNAMHYAEKVLNEKRIRSYAFTLAQVLDTSPTVDLDDQFLNIHATASQRAESFLRTVGKWKEAKP